MAPIAAVVVYPRAKWLFGFVPIGVALLIYHKLTAKGPTPQEVADHAERLLSGAAWAWDVDDYEHLNPKDPALNDLWRGTMAVGGLPEQWTRLDKDKQAEMRDIIRKLRQMRANNR